MWAGEGAAGDGRAVAIPHQPQPNQPTHPSKTLRALKVANASDATSKLAASTHSNRRAMRDGDRSTAAATLSCRTASRRAAPQLRAMAGWS